ncbi:hypothetical protein PIROE2DRAFT_24817, partial [Piromyces sp. E2]
WASLHLASRNGHEKIVKVLVEHGADLNIVNNENSNPLHLASRNGYEKVVKVLVEHGA